MYTHYGRVGVIPTQRVYGLSGNSFCSSILCSWLVHVLSFLTTGLLVKVRDINETRQPYSYALVPYSAQVDTEGIDWITLSTSNVGEPHVRCHIIDQYSLDGKELQTLTYKFKAEGAVAVVVVNQFNNLYMDCLTTLTKIPVLVVASSTKERLQEVISHEKGALCKIFPTAPTTEELMSPLRKGIHIDHTYTCTCTVHVLFVFCVGTSKAPSVLYSSYSTVFVWSRAVRILSKAPPVIT